MTSRQEQIIELQLKGLTLKQIAGALNITSRTVDREIATLKRLAAEALQAKEARRQGQADQDAQTHRIDEEQRGPVGGRFVAPLLSAGLPQLA